MLNDFFSRINQKWKEFLYGNFCSQIKNLFSDYGHVVANPTKFTDEQPVQINLQERFKTAEENPGIFLSFIGYSFDQFVAQLPDENLQKKLIEHYEKEVLPTLKGNEAEKMKDFINDYKNDGWKIVAHEDCLLPDEALDMSEYEIVAPDDCPLPDKNFDMSKGKIVEEPSKEMQGANITAHNPKTLFGFIGRFLG